ncbi:MAG: S8 family serine peptidase [Bacillota bacterium]
MAGIEWAMGQNMQVINMSLGASSAPTTLKDVCDLAYYEKGIVIVSSAGNSGLPNGRGDNISYPARYDSMIAVGATTSSDVRAQWSSTGPTLEIMAPGESIPSLRLGGGVISYSGTSMASPHVAGVAALLLAAKPGLTNAEIRDIMNQVAQKVADRDSWKYGAGGCQGDGAGGTGNWHWRRPAAGQHDHGGERDH